VIATFGISKEMMQDSEQTSPASKMIPSLRNANDRLVEITGKSIPLRFGLYRSDRFAASEEKVVGFATL
jgi:hypothetical protein